jgi:hypothetical protein
VLGEVDDSGFIDDLGVLGSLGKSRLSGPDSVLSWVAIISKGVVLNEMYCLYLVDLFGCRCRVLGV